MRVLFGRLVSDQPDLLNGELEEALNCIPYQQGYGPFPAPVAYSSSLTGRAFAAYSTKDTSGNVNTFAATQGALWRTSATGFADVSRTLSYTTATDGHFEFATFGNTLLAVNGIDAMQVYTQGTSTRFRDQSATASAPIAAHIAAVRDFVFAGKIVSFQNRVQWCWINNPLRWTPTVQRQADYQDLPGGGASVQRITGGDFAAILTDSSVWRGSYVGSPLIFRFDEMAPGIGCAASGSVSRFQNITYFLAHSGFYAFDGQQAIPIGNERIDDTFREDYASSYPYRVTSAIDPVNKLYVVSYPSVASSDGTPDTMLLFNWLNGRFTFVEQPANLIYAGLSAGVTLEGLDAYGTLDALPFSLDSPVWQGGAQLLSIVDTGNRIAQLTGAAKAARFITGEAQIVEDARAFLRAIKPLVQGNGSTSITTTVGQRDRLIDSVSWGTASAMNSTGLCPVRSNARFHRVRMDVTGGFDRAMGFDLDVRREGVR